MQADTLKTLPDTFGEQVFAAHQPENWTTELLDDVLVLHHHLSNDIHMLNFLSHGLLSLLEQEACTAKELVGRFRQEFDLSEDDCPPALVFRTLDDLDKAGLICPLPKG